MKRYELLFFVSWAAGVHGAQPDVNALVKQSIANYQRDWREAAQWRFKQVDTTFSGERKNVETTEVIPLLGTPYERLTAKNGNALPADSKIKEDEKYKRALERRQNESAAERAARIRKREEEWSFLKDLPNAYDFALLGEDTVNGRSSWVVGMTRRPGFTPATNRGSMLKHIEGKLWIDKQEVQWAKAEARVADTIGFGWVLARVGPGAEIRLVLTRVAPGVWLPESVEVKGSAKVMMVHRRNLDEQITFADYAPVADCRQNSCVAELYKK